MKVFAIRSTADVPAQRRFLEAVAARLQGAGFPDAHIIDESFGRSLRVTDPEGFPIQINEAMQDLHGYHAEQPA